MKAKNFTANAVGGKASVAVTAKLRADADVVKRVNGELIAGQRTSLSGASRKVMDIVRGTRFSAEEIEEAARVAMRQRLPRTA